MHLDDALIFSQPWLEYLAFERRCCGIALAFEAIAAPRALQP
jgi:hypothetical protein